MGRIRVRPEAARDLETIFGYIGAISEERATQYIQTIAQHLDILASAPHMGRVRNEILAGLRSFPIRRHIVFYMPLEHETGIDVIRILHTARDIGTVFE